ncbi:hypothetical protein COCNU_scaffold019918G000010 [Cocos nucifera]|nr:hypothetical protein [Cocos nucifera]
MERLPAVEEEQQQQQQQQQQQHGFFSCWGSLCGKIRRLGWRRRRRGKLYARRGSFKYDPLSYSQNFDEGGGWEEEEEAERSYRGFSSRYAAPHTLSSGQP